ncbi:helix-turn-helix domain-containing protein [uncultured Desulfobacter sp.]|uniref:helix-turn-helix domain-containing protein n=1 Tax=uncultured Desulfobacter sp. TaxID=240139 RepID=UPI002AA5FE48|nr:helix-turn-helix domain-containing protein [uncultured Desulfobacter sp.]
MAKRLLRPDEVATQLSVSKRSVYRLIADGYLPALKVGSTLRVTQADVDKYIQRQLDIFALENGTTCDRM